MSIIQDSSRRNDMVLFISCKERTVRNCWNGALFATIFKWFYLMVVYSFQLKEPARWFVPWKFQIFSGEGYESPCPSAYKVEGKKKLLSPKGVICMKSAGTVRSQFRRNCSGDCGAPQQAKCKVGTTLPCLPTWMNAVFAGISQQVLRLLRKSAQWILELNLLKHVWSSGIVTRWGVDKP